LKFEKYVFCLVVKVRERNVHGRLWQVNVVPPDVCSQKNNVKKAISHVKKSNKSMKVILLHLMFVPKRIEKKM